MLRRILFSLLLSSLLFGYSLNACFAQGPINSAPSNTPEKHMFAWTFRTGTSTQSRAIALNIKNASGLQGKLCMYAITGSQGDEYFQKKEIKINDPAAGDAVVLSGTAIHCTLVPVLNQPNKYNIMVQPTVPVDAQPLAIGWLSSISEGKVSLIRWRPDTITVDGTSAIGVNPCDEPPADDVGEEELISTNSSDTSIPGPTLTLVAGPRSISNSTSATPAVTSTPD